MSSETISADEIRDGQNFRDRVRALGIRDGDDGAAHPAYWFGVLENAYRVIAPVRLSIVESIQRQIAQNPRAHARIVLDREGYRELIEELSQRGTVVGDATPPAPGTPVQLFGRLVVSPEGTVWER